MSGKAHWLMSGVLTFFLVMAVNFNEVTMQQTIGMAMAVLLIEVRAIQVSIEKRP